VNEEALAHWGLLRQKVKKQTKKEPIVYISLFYILPHVANSKTEVGSVKYFSLEKGSTDHKA
jgi:hypothetical protein